MHELAVTESILEIAMRHAATAGADEITDLYLVVGELSSYVDESIQFYWEIIAGNTPAAGATLHFERVPARLRCRACGHQYAPGDDLGCPACKGATAEVVTGDEFYLAAINVRRRAAEAATGPPEGGG